MGRVFNIENSKNTSLCMFLYGKGIVTDLEMGNLVKSKKRRPESSLFKKNRKMKVWVL
jgi:hypothetical protein